MSRLMLKKNKKKRRHMFMAVFMQLCTQNNLQPVSFATQSAAPAVVFGSCWLEMLLKLDVGFNPVRAAELIQCWTISESLGLVCKTFPFGILSAVLLVLRLLFCFFPHISIYNVSLLSCSQSHITSCSPTSLRSGVFLKVIKTSSWKPSYPLTFFRQFSSICLSDSSYFWSGDVSLYVSYCK